MLPIAAIVLALFSVGLTLALARLLAEDRKEFREELARLRQAVTSSPPTVSALPAINPLEGLRIGIQIQQDHEKPTFAELLQARLAAEDAEGVIVTGEPDHDFNVMVSGSIACNGYADVYYAADLIATAGGETVTKISEKPADGRRQANLAAGFVGKLKKDLAQKITADERRLALREIEIVSPRRGEVP